MEILRGDKLLNAIDVENEPAQLGGEGVALRRLESALHPTKPYFSPLGRHQRNSPLPRAALAWQLDGNHYDFGEINQQQ